MDGDSGANAFTATELEEMFLSACVAPTDTWSVITTLTVRLYYHIDSQLYRE